MERVKDISKIRIVDGNVLIQIHKKKSRIIMPDSDESTGDIDYATVVAVTESIDDIEVGDIVADFASSYGFKWDNFFFAIVPRHSIRIAVKPDNFKLKMADGKAKK